MTSLNTANNDETVVPSAPPTIDIYNVTTQLLNDDTGKSDEPTTDPFPVEYPMGNYSPDVININTDNSIAGDISNRNSNITDNGNVSYRNSLNTDGITSNDDLPPPPDYDSVVGNTSCYYTPST